MSKRRVIPLPIYKVDPESQQHALFKPKQVLLYTKYYYNNMRVRLKYKALLYTRLAKKTYDAIMCVNTVKGGVSPDLNQI